MDVKAPPPPRRRTLRAERAALTRSRITDAARRLFRLQGYGATTLQAVADEAGVAVQTVYAVFTSKAGILRELREALVHQPEAERLFGAALVADEPRQRLTLFAQSIRVRWAAGGDIVLIYQEAASTDLTLRAELDAVLARRRGGISRLAEALAGSIRPGLAPTAAAAILDALTLPDVYAEVSGVHGWTPEAFEAWLTNALCRELLETP